MNLYEEFFSIIHEFEKQDITYAVIGGIALAFHDKPRFTRDIDILLKSSDLGKVEDILEKMGFFKSTDPHNFLNVDLILHRFVKADEGDHLVVDILVGEDEKFSDVFENAVQSKWEKGEVSIASREDLIRLKQMRGSEQDKADIKNLTDNEEGNEN